MNYFIGLDIGTTAVKGILVSSEGKVIAETKKATKLIYPKERFIEFNPEKHYKTVCSVISKLASNITNSNDIISISMAAASGNTLLLKASGGKYQPITNIISWMDGRAASLDVNELNLDEVHEIVGWPWPRGYFPLAHLLWFKENKSEMYARVQRVCMNNDWLYYCLTSNWKLDNSTATTFYLQNQVERAWYKPYLA